MDEIAVSKRQLPGGAWKLSVTNGTASGVWMYDDEPDDFEVGERVIALGLSALPVNAEFIVPDDGPELLDFAGGQF